MQKRTNTNVVTTKRIGAAIVKLSMYMRHLQSLRYYSYVLYYHILINSQLYIAGTEPIRQQKYFYLIVLIILFCKYRNINNC